MLIRSGETTNDPQNPDNGPAAPLRPARSHPTSDPLEEWSDSGSDDDALASDHSHVSNDYLDLDND